MDIAASALDEMFSGFNTVFNNALNATPIYWNKIAMDVKSTGADETYGWLASVPQMREWLVLTTERMKTGPRGFAS